MFKNHGRSRHSSKNLPLGKTLRSQQHHEYLNTRRWIFLNKNKHCLTQYLFTFLTSQDILEKSKQPVSCDENYYPNLQHSWNMLKLLIVKYLILAIQVICGISKILAILTFEVGFKKINFFYKRWCFWQYRFEKNFAGFVDLCIS